VGWKLAEEVVAARPAKPGPEWWTLMDIAMDANDDSRRAMPGEAFLMLRARCSKATFYRRMAALESDGLIKTVRRAAPGTRAVYEVLPLLTGLSVSETRSVDNHPP
jgi:hypothetical protein